MIAGNDFVVVDLRIDVPEVLGALDYQVWLAALGGPTGNYPTFTSAWLSVNLDNKPGLYGEKFSQIGLMANSRGVFWFVYAEPGVQCWRGNYTYYNNDLGKYLGCQGEVGDIVNFGEFYKVELVKYPNDNFWIARINNSQGNSFDVAKILSSSNSIYDVDVNMEEGWSQVQDPYEYGVFHIWHPQYNSWIDGFREWPNSGNSINNLYAFPSSICPLHYGALINRDNDPRYWVAGTGGTTCNAVMFQPIKLYISFIINN